MKPDVFDDAAAPPAALALFRNLGDPARLAILLALAGGELRVIDLTRRLGLAQSTVSTHLSCLRDCGLVAYRPQGRQSFYYLARPELMDLLRAAESFLALSGNAVELCRTYAEPDGTDPRAWATTRTKETR